jgi:hypothetical protein
MHQDLRFIYQSMRHKDKERLASLTNVDLYF